MSYSEVERVAGYVGNFTVTVRRKPRYVNEQLCTGCGTCIEKCPWKKIPSEFDLGLGKRAAIYYPFPQAVPRIPVIDTANCAYFKNGKCKACEKFCTVGRLILNRKNDTNRSRSGRSFWPPAFMTSIRRMLRSMAMAACPMW
jgi:heterodisulfide reductase subunit A